eukprot:6178493-Pyramimonas_sp.AAC.1
MLMPSFTEPSCGLDRSWTTRYLTKPERCLSTLPMAAIPWTASLVVGTSLPASLSSEILTETFLECSRGT